VKFIFFCHVTFLKSKFTLHVNFCLNADDPRPRCSNKTIFKMAAIRQIEFVKFGIWPGYLCLESDSAMRFLRQALACNRSLP